MKKIKRKIESEEENIQIGTETISTVPSSWWEERLKIIRPKPKGDKEIGGVMEKETELTSHGRMPTGKMGEMTSKGGMPTGKMGEMTSKGGMPTGKMGEMTSKGGMPTGKMGEMASKGGMPTGVRVLVEMRISRGQSAAYALQKASELKVPNFQLDTSYMPVRIKPRPEHTEQLKAANEEVVIVRGTIEESKIPELEAQPNVIKVWRDTIIKPFAKDIRGEQSLIKVTSPAFSTCPIPPCDCDPGTAKGTIADVAHYLGVDQIWAAAIKGDGVVIGIVDGGITALGRTPKPGETAKIPRVIGGWPTADWGTTAAAWGDHGNMTSTDALGMAPNAQIYDIRISDGDTISNALAGFQWAIDQHKADGTPQVLSNSWGIFQKSWDPDYACNPNHPFTRKVVEALDEGILVLFAAGNCGDTCPDGRCGSDAGPGKAIWGANGHPRVMTVGAVNINEQFVGYSSPGPACLDPNKPDFCSITHFKGYFSSDSGTSAATPIAAGVVALLKQANPSTTQDEVKALLKNTAKDIGSPGWDQYSGAGIIRANAAFGGGALGRLEVFARGTDHALWHIWQTAPNNGWSGWDSLGGWIDQPVVARNADGRLEVFVIGSDHALWHNWQTAPNNGWSGWASMGGTIDMLVVGQNADGRLEIFARGMDGAGWHIWQTAPSNGWSNWDSLGGVIDLLAIGRNADGRLEIFARGMDGAVWHNWQTAPNNGWSGWASMGGTIDMLAVGQNADGRLEIFARGMDRALWHIWQTAPNNGWSNWDSLGGWIDRPVVGRNADGRLEVFVIGSDHALWHNWQTAPNNGWSGWASFGGWIDMQAIGQNADGRLEVFARGMDGALWHIWQTAPSNGWSGWASMGGTIDMLTVGQNSG